MLPEAAERVAAVTRFGVDGAGRPTGAVELADGRVLGGVDRVVLATGYITSYPFLGPALQAPAAAADESVVIAADGCVTHNLHEDMFYIPDPTLVFVGVPYHISTFSLYDLQAQVVARVFAGRARLPARADMRAEYARRRAESSLDGKLFHSLGAENKEVEYMTDLREWVNAGDAGDPVAAPTPEWLEAHRAMKARVALSRRPLDGI